jgi:signal peptidase II
VPTPRISTKRLFALGLALLIVVADRMTKLYIQESLHPFDIIPVIPGLLQIVHVENPGAAFGVLAEGSSFLRSIILIGISSLVMCFVAGALWMGSVANASLLHVLGLGSILGGAVGNLYDRIAYGTVTDFIEVFHQSWSFPAFNVADSAITLGAALLFIDIVRPGRTRAVRDSWFPGRRPNVT